MNKIESWLNIPYRASRHPDNHLSKSGQGGSNCQLFAVDFLNEALGFTIPYLRSKELWEDNVWTRQVDLIKESLEVGDLVFYTSSEEADMRLAHIGVVAGVNEGGSFSVIHNSKEEGKSAIWENERFLANERYQVLRGAKRYLRR